MAGIFKKFSQMYGHIWSSQAATADATEDKMRTWAKVLAGVQPAEIGKALERLPDMPPSAPQFRAICKQDAPACTAHKKFPKALPKPLASKESSLAALSVIKHNLRVNPSPSLDGKFVKEERAPADEEAFKRGHKYEERKARGFMTEDGKPIYD